MVLFEMPFGYFVVKGNQLNGTNSSETAEWFNSFLCRYVKPIPIRVGWQIASNTQAWLIPPRLNLKKESEVNHLWFS